MSEPLPSGDSAALLLLVRELSGGMQALRENGAKQSEDTHAVRLAMAEIKAQLAPLSKAAQDMAALTTTVALNTARIKELDDVERRVSSLEDANSQRKGWEGPAGKVGYAIIAALAAALVTFVFTRPASAAIPDIRLDNTANAKCYAAPAKQKPRHLNV